MIKWRHLKVREPKISFKRSELIWVEKRLNVTSTSRLWYRHRLIFTFIFLEAIWLFSCLSLLALRKLAVMLDSFANSQRSNSFHALVVMILPCSENATQLLIGSLWDTHQHCFTISYQNVPSSWAVVCLRFIWERVGIFVVTRDEMDAIWNHQFIPCGNCHRSPTRLGDSRRIIWSIRGQVLQTSDEISSIWKNLDLQYPPCLFSVCLCPRQYPSLDISTLHKPNILLIDHGTNPSRQIQPLLQAGGYWSKKHVYYLSGFHPHFTCIYTLFWETNETSTLISSKPVNLPLLQPNSFNGNLRIIHKALIDLHILQAGM